MHQIMVMVYPSKKTKGAILKECNKIAEREGDYHHRLDGGIRFNDTVLKNEEEAGKWIEDHDRGWYDNLAVRFKEGRKINWLVKFEFHV